MKQLHVFWGGEFVCVFVCLFVCLFVFVKRRSDMTSVLGRDGFIPAVTFVLHEINPSPPDVAVYVWTLLQLTLIHYYNLCIAREKLF